MFYGLIKLIRPDLASAAGICVIIGQLLALGQVPDILTLCSGFLSVFLISGAILVSNDVIDYETDKVNAPHRPLPSGVVTKKEAILFTLLLLGAGLLLSSFTGIISFLVALLLAAIGFIYNRFAKKSGLPGNLMVSISVGTTFLYGGVTTGQPPDGAIIFFSVITALFDLGEEIASDTMDAEGDKKINSRSLAILYGEDRAIKIASAVLFLIIPVTTIPFLINLFSFVYALPLLYLNGVIVYYVTKLLKAGTKNGKEYTIKLYRHGAVSLVLFLIIRLLFK